MGVQQQHEGHMGAAGVQGSVVNLSWEEKKNTTD